MTVEKKPRTERNTSLKITKIQKQGQCLLTEERTCRGDGNKVFLFGVIKKF